MHKLKHTNIKLTCLRDIARAALVTVTTLDNGGTIRLEHNVDSTSAKVALTNAWVWPDIKAVTSCDRINNRLAVWCFHVYYSLMTATENL